MAGGPGRQRPRATRRARRARILRVPAQPAAPLPATPPANPTPPAYAGSRSWLRYRELLDECFGIRLSQEPEELWTSVRGHRLHVDRWRPSAAAAPGAPAGGTVILVHGGGGHGRILAPVGEFVATLGWQALAPDLPGYGLTRPAPGFAWDYAEWPAVVAELAEACAGPVVLLGLSVGGLTAVHAARRAPRVAGVIATTLLDMSDPAAFVGAARWRWLAAASLLGFRLMPRLTDRIALPLRWVAPMHAMSSHPRMQAYFVDDTLLGARHVPARLFRTLHAHAVDTAPLHCPLLLVHPGADAWTPTALSRSTFDRLQGTKRFRELTNGSHLPAEQPALDELRQEVASALAEAAGRRPQHAPPRAPST